MIERETDRPRPGGAARAFTMVELLICLLILTILALIAVPGLQHFQTQAKVSASKANQRVLADGLELYFVDYGVYPHPRPAAGDAFGVVSHAALATLTTPIAYVSPAAFRDPFGLLQLQTASVNGPKFTDDDPFRPPTPGYNIDQSLLYIHYPSIATLLDESGMQANAYAIISVGPDLKDSFILYYPFPGSLPSRSVQYGIVSTADTVYDPSNGTISGGDLAAFGGSLSVPRLVGGGN